MIEKYFNELDEHETSSFPPVGRFRLIGFGHYGTDICARIVCMPETDRDDPGIGDLQAITLNCDHKHLAVMWHLLPKGDERHYIHAIHKAVEALNGMNMDFGDAITIANRLCDMGEFDAILKGGYEQYRAELQNALVRLKAFGSELEQGFEITFQPVP